MSSDFERNNPYAAPAIRPAFEDDASRQRDSHRRIRWPTIGLAVCAAGNLVYLAIVFATYAWLFVSGMAPPADADEWPVVIATASFLFAIAAQQVVVIVGCVKLIGGQFGRWSWAAGVAGLLPFGFQWCAWIEFAFAIWLLILLFRKTNRAAR